MTPLGVGGDGLGSLRWPAQCCGISALKPTLGRIPAATSIEPADEPIGVQLTLVEGPMARRVADLRAALAVMAGPSWRDPWTVPAPLRGPEPARPIRVALVADPVGQGTAQQVQEGVQTAGQALEAAGYAVDELEPSSIAAAATADLAMLNTAEIRAALPLVSLLPADTQRFLTAYYEAAGDPDPAATLQGFMTRQSLLRAWGQFQETHPLIVAPIFTGVPFEVGADLADGAVAETIRGDAHGYRRQRTGPARRGTSRGYRGRPASIGAGDRPSVPRGPVPGCRGRAGGQPGHHHADRSHVARRARMPVTSQGRSP
jgi:amidase